MQSKRLNEINCQCPLYLHRDFLNQFFFFSLGCTHNFMSPQFPCQSRCYSGYWDYLILWVGWSLYWSLHISTQKKNPLIIIITTSPYVALKVMLLHTVHSPLLSSLKGSSPWWFRWQRWFQVSQSSLISEDMDRLFQTVIMWIVITCNYHIWGVMVSFSEFKKTWHFSWSRHF